MAIITYTIPLANIDSQALITTVGPDTVKIRVWRKATDTRYWYAIVESPPGDVITGARRITLNQPLIGHKSPKSLLAGDFYCIALSSRFDEPAADPWGRTHDLVYRYDDAVA